MHQLKKYAKIYSKEGSTIINPNLLRDFPFFRIFSLAQLETISQDAENLSFESGEIIFQGEPFAISALLEPHIFTSTAWVSRPSRAIKIEAPDLRDLCKKDKRLAYALTR